MIRISFVLVFQLLSIGVFAQQPDSCSRLLDSPIKGSADDGTVGYGDLDLDRLVDCGYLDPVDIELITPPVLGFFLFEKQKENQRITYGQVLTFINDIKAEPEYQELVLREGIWDTLGQKTVNPETWPDDRKLFERLEVEHDVIEQLDAVISTGLFRHISYLLLYQVSLVEVALAKEPKPSDEPYFRFEEFVEYETALADAKHSGKPLLLLFSGYRAKEALKMEGFIIETPEITQEIDGKFLSYVIFTDSRTKLPQDKVYESEVLGRTVITYGDVYTELLRGRFNAEELPHFAIVDPEGITLRQFSGATRDVTAFVCFLRGCE